MPGRPKMKARASRQLLALASQLVVQINQTIVSRFGDNAPPPLWHRAKEAAINAHVHIEMLVQSLHAKAEITWPLPATSEGDDARIGDERSIPELAEQLVVEVAHAVPPMHLNVESYDNPVALAWGNAVAVALRAHFTVRDVPDLPGDRRPPLDLDSQFPEEWLQLFSDFMVRHDERLSNSCETVPPA